MLPAQSGSTSRQLVGLYAGNLVRSLPRSDLAKTDSRLELISEQL